MCSISYCSLQLWSQVHPRLFLSGNPENCARTPRSKSGFSNTRGLSRYANSFNITFFAILRGHFAVRWKEQVR
jgi:hypothetical protein